MLGGPDVNMSHELRLDGAFVDYEGGSFVLGKEASLTHPMDLSGLIHSVRAKNDELRALVVAQKLPT